MNRAGIGAQRISLPRQKKRSSGRYDQASERRSQDVPWGLCWSNYSADEHDLAGRSGFKDLLVCARRVGEWQFLANHGAQGAVFETRQKSRRGCPPLQSV